MVDATKDAYSKWWIMKSDEYPLVSDFWSTSTGRIDALESEACFVDLSNQPTSFKVFYLEQRVGDMVIVSLYPDLDSTEFCRFQWIALIKWRIWASCPSKLLGIE